MALLTLALAVLLAQLFPISVILYDSLEIIPGAALPAGLHAVLTWAIDYGPALLVAWWCLRRLGVHRVANELAAGRRFIKAGLLLYAIYLLLAASGLLVSAMPYGGGTIPRVLGLLLSAVRAFLFLGVVAALVYELPRLRGGAQPVDKMREA